MSSERSGQGAAAPRSAGAGRATASPRREPGSAGAAEEGRGIAAAAADGAARWRLALALVGLLAAPAAAEELHLLGAVDLYGTTPGTAAGPAVPAGQDAELGLTVQAELRRLRGWVDLGLDYRDLEGLVDRSAASRHELFDLHATAHLGRFDLTVGRFPTPGGFWLIADGARLAARFGERFAGEIYGGLRAFTGGRVETHLTADPVALPLAGAALRFDHPMLHASLLATYTQDRLELHRGCVFPRTMDKTDWSGCPGAERLVAQDAGGRPLVEDELLVSAQALVLPHPDVLLAGGLTLGSRYDLAFANAAPYPVASVGVAEVGSIDAHALAEWRPWRRLRLAYVFDFVRVRILQSTLLSGAGVADGSFEDHTLKATVRPFGALRLEARYRLRLRESSDVIHRVEAALHGDDVLAGFGLFATFGGDFYQKYHQVGAAPARLVYSGGLSYLRALVDVRAGVLYTDGLGGCTQPLSNPLAPVAGGGCPAPPTELFPFAPETQRIAFVRAFATLRGAFAGIDLEMNLDASQLRGLAQIGYAR